MLTEGDEHKGHIEFRGAGVDPWQQGGIGYAWDHGKSIEFFLIQS